MIKGDLALDVRSENLVATLSVGWLGEEQLLEFQRTARAPRGGLAPILWQFCRRSVLRRRGVLFCPVCNSAVVASNDDESLLLGGAEIRTFLDGQVYAAPDLIFTTSWRMHAYLPPSVFVDSVLRPPWPRTGAYSRLVGEAIR